MRQSDYYPIAFTDQEWAALEQVFPGGVCDWGKPGVDQRPTIAWLTYQNPDGTVVYGGKPLGAAPPGSGAGWASSSFGGWLSGH
jgi:hypothetical protein